MRHSASKTSDIVTTASPPLEAARAPARLPASSMTAAYRGVLGGIFSYSFSAMFISLSFGDRMKHTPR